VLGLVREQGWLADRALEVVLRREKRLYSVERRAAAEAVYGVLRAQGRIEWLLGHRAAIAELYAAALASPGGLPQAQAERRLGLARGALAPLTGAEARIQAIDDPVQRLGGAHLLGRGERPGAPHGAGQSAEGNPGRRPGTA
jgi:16S rRNA (cytosine967-C5)-methyltransferase